VKQQECALREAFVSCGSVVGLRGRSNSRQRSSLLHSRLKQTTSLPLQPAIRRLLPANPLSPRLFGDSVPISRPWKRFDRAAA